MPPKKRRRHVRRRQAIWGLCDFTSGHGLEIGPLTRPIVRRHKAAVEYVDVLDTEGLRAHYAGDKDVPPDRIQDVDYHLMQEDGTVLDLVEATRAGAPFDWVVASHVIEHVPDVIGWLDEIAHITVNGGALVLVIPDRRYCFDAIRPPTTVGQMVDAHHGGDQVPSYRAVYDHFSGVVNYNLPALWRDEVPGYDQRIYGIDAALAEAERVRAGEYVDCHVWLWTPEDFLRQSQDLRRAGLSQWYVESLVPTLHGDLEFQVLLRRLDRLSEAREADPPGEQPPTAARPEWVEDRVRGHEVEELRRRVATLDEEIAQRDRDLEQLRGSRRYRIGGVIAAAPDRLRRLRRR